MRASLLFVVLLPLAAWAADPDPDQASFAERAAPETTLLAPVEAERATPATPATRDDPSGKGREPLSTPAWMLLAGLAAMGVMSRRWRQRS